MSLDTITYTSNGDGTFNKVITHVVTAEFVANELSALQSQLVDFQQSQAQNPTDEIAAAITNYEAQIAILQGG